MNNKDNYTEIYKNKSRSSAPVLSVIIACGVAFYIISVSGIKDYVWVFQTTVLLAAAVGIYFLLRIRFYEYVYSVSDGEISVVLRISGGKEQTVCLFSGDLIRGIYDISEVPIKVLKKQNGIKTVYNCTGSFAPGKGTAVVFSEPEKNSLSLLVFCPGTKFLQIISGKSVDKD